MSVNKPSAKRASTPASMVVSSGNVVGDLAMGLFGDFVEVTTMTEEGKHLDKARKYYALAEQVKANTQDEDLLRAGNPFNA